VAGAPDPFRKWERCRNGQAFGETMILKSIAVWLLFLLVVVASGAFRERFLVPRLGDQRAHQVGTILACLLVFAVMTRAVPWIGPDSGCAWFLGAFWLALALAFEFGVFHCVLKVPWSQLTADTNVLKGRLLVLLWLTILLGPTLVLVITSGGDS